MCGRRFVAARKTPYISIPVVKENRTPVVQESRIPVAQGSGSPERRSARLTRTHIAFALLSIVCAAIVVAAITAVPASTPSPAMTEATFPVMVLGYVWDAMYTPLAGAEVNVSMVKPDTTLRTYWTDTTDSSGMYSVTFAPSEWEIGDTILVVAECGMETGTNSTIALDSNVHPAQYVNVTVGTAIPEFSDLGTVVSVVGVLGLFMMVFSARKRKDR